MNNGMQMQILTSIQGLLLFCVVSLFMACDKQKPQATTTNTVNSIAVAKPIGHLIGGAESPDALLNTALIALQQGDTAALLRIAITQQEFNRFIYPEMGRHYPAAHDTTQQARDFVWENQYLSSLKAMLKGLREQQGKPMQLLSIRYGSRKDFGAYQLLEDPVVRVRTDADEKELRIFGAIVYMAGNYKLLSYREPDGD